MSYFRLKEVMNELQLCVVDGFYADVDKKEISRNIFHSLRNVGNISILFLYDTNEIRYQFRILLKKQQTACLLKALWYDLYIYIHIGQILYLASVYQVHVHLLTHTFTIFTCIKCNRVQRYAFQVGTLGVINNIHDTIEALFS